MCITPCACARALLRFSQRLCVANNAFVHACAPARRSRPRSDSFFVWQVRGSSASPTKTELPPNQGRAADRKGRNPASAHKTLIEPDSLRCSNGTVKVTRSASCSSRLILTCPLYDRKLLQPQNWELQCSSSVCVSSMKPVHKRCQNCIPSRMHRS